ncbi:MAG: sulfite exporter TauE/SafE family protein [Oscillospiraceae bacterium]|nr:sulfite exporter TauE/SafE family protein [Oscillospiraceae bacterium]
MFWVIVVTAMVMFLGATAQASTGFGFALISMAILPLMLPVADILIMVPFVSLPGIIIVFIKNFRHINYRILAIPAIISFIITIIGFRVVLASENVLIMRLLGGVLLLLSVYFYFFSHKVRIPVNNASATVVGLTSGVLGGLFGIGGPPMALFCAMATRDKQEYIATTQAFFVIVLTTRIIDIILFVGFTETVATILPFALGAALLGMVLGMYIFNKMNVTVLQKAVYVVMALAGLSFLLGLN